jgi:hypothetical protein
MTFKLTPKAQGVYSLVNNEGVDPNDLVEPEMWSCSDGFWYGLTNGYIEPKDILADAEDIQKIKEALVLLEKFESLWQDISYEF